MHHILYNIFDFTLVLGGKIHISEDTNAILIEHGNFLINRSPMLMNIEIKPSCWIVFRCGNQLCNNKKNMEGKYVSPNICILERCDG
jgi:hypothetical protein